MADLTVPVLDAPPIVRDNPLTRSVAGLIGGSFLVLMFALCIGGAFWTFAKVQPQNGQGQASPRYDLQDRYARHLPPSWWPAYGTTDDKNTPKGRLRDTSIQRATRRHAASRGITTEEVVASGWTPNEEQIREARPFSLMGTDLLGRDLFVRCLAGGGISLGIGLSAALISVLLGTLYGAVSGYVGGRVDAIMMRIVDILFGLPYILLVVLLAVAVEAKVDDVQAGLTKRVREQQQAHVETALAAIPEPQREDEAVRNRLLGEAREIYGTGELSAFQLRSINVLTLLIAIGGVSWLTMARVVRGQVLSLKAQPFMEASRAIGVPVHKQFLRHLLPNLMGPIVVYATLTVPQAILQESFLSFLGIGVRPPVPSWGNLAADGLDQLNPYRSNWWLLLFPCLLLGATLLALNFIGEGLREAFDPKRARR